MFMPLYDDSGELFDAPSIDYAAQEAADRAEEEAWLNRLPWLTELERQALTSHPDYPTGMATEADYDAFALKLRRSCQRRVECIYELGYAKVQGALDLVTGATYLMQDGRYERTDDLPERVSIEFADERDAVLRGVEVLDEFVNVSPAPSSREPERATLTEILSKRRPGVSVFDMQRVVEHLTKVSKLPAVEASVNGKRFGTFRAL